MQLKKKIARVTGLIEKHGWLGLLIKAEEKSTEPVNLRYREQYQHFLPGEKELEKERETAFSYLPKISIVVPAYRTPGVFLKELIESVEAQTYSNWELCIADGSPDDSVKTIVENYQEKDERIRYTKLADNTGISGNTNAGFAMADGEYIGLLDHDDVLAPNALFEVVKCLNDFVYEEQSDETRLVVSEKMPQLLYSDEDKVSADLKEHFEPHFKSDYNEELLHHYNYICHFVVFHRSMLEKVGFLDSSYDGAQDYDYMLRCTEVLSSECIYHIPKILYHWRVHEASTAASSASKDYAYEAGKRAVAAHLKRTGRNAQVETAKGREYINVTYKLPKKERQKGTLPEIEALEENVYIVKQGRGVKNPSKNWQQKMMRYFSNQKPSDVEKKESGVDNSDKIGMVCGKLIRGGRVLACGYTYDEKGNVYPLFQGLKVYQKGYFRRAAVPQNISLGSLEFCMIDREAYQKVGGFDRTLPAPYRDLDFAFRLREAGYQIVLVPSIRAFCMEEEQVEEEEAKKARQILRERWNPYLMEGDPYYNSNLVKGQETFRLKEETVS